MVDGITDIVYRMTYSSTGKSNIYRCNQNYGLLYKFFLVVKLVNSSVIFMMLQTWHLELPHPWHPTFLSTIYNLDLTV